MTDPAQTAQQVQHATEIGAAAGAGGALGLAAVIGAVAKVWTAVFGTRKERADDTVYGQAIVIPTAYVGEMLSWAEAYVKPTYEHDDGRVGMWARATKRGVYTPVPQLVRHMEGPSLMGHPAARGLGTPLFAADRKDVNWDTEALQVQGHIFGNAGLRADAPAALKSLFGVSAEPETRKSQLMEELRQRYAKARREEA